MGTYLAVVTVMVIILTSFSYCIIYRTITGVFRILLLVVRKLPTSSSTYFFLQAQVRTFPPALISSAHVVP